MSEMPKTTELTYKEFKQRVTEMIASYTGPLTQQSSGLLFSLLKGGANGLADLFKEQGRSLVYFEKDADGEYAIGEVYYWDFLEGKNVVGKDVVINSFIDHLTEKPYIMKSEYETSNYFGINGLVDLLCTLSDNAKNLSILYAWNTEAEKSPNDSQYFEFENGQLGMSKKDLYKQGEITREHLYQ